MRWFRTKKQKGLNMASPTIPATNQPTAAFVAGFVSDIQARLAHDNANAMSYYTQAFNNWVQQQSTAPPGNNIPQPDPANYPLYNLTDASGNALALEFLAYSDALYKQSIGLGSGKEPVLNLASLLTKSAPARLTAPSTPVFDPSALVLSPTPIYPNTPFYRATAGDSGYVPEGTEVTIAGHMYSKEYSVFLGPYWLRLS